MLDDFEERDIAEIALFISTERLAAFREIAGNERDAIILHQQVLAVGSALAPILAIFEIALRNAICEQLRTAFGLPVSGAMLRLLRLPVFRRDRRENSRFPVLLARRYAESSDTLHCPS